MRSWPAPETVALPNRGGPLSVHDTVTGSRRTITPGATARMYVCGITPYDAAHLGHAFTYLTFDLVNRVWRDAGHTSTTCRTSPTSTTRCWSGPSHRTGLARARRAGDPSLPRGHGGAADPAARAPSSESSSRSTSSPTSWPASRARGAPTKSTATSTSPLPTPPASVASPSWTATAMLELFAERGGDPGRAGRKTRWTGCCGGRNAPANPPGTPPGPRTSRLARGVQRDLRARTGMGFDLNGGGDDLIFPHHEMGAAEACCATGEPPPGPPLPPRGHGRTGRREDVQVAGQPGVRLPARKAGTDPMAIRLALLAHHYRTAWEWTDADLRTAEQRLERWRAAAAVENAPDARPLLARVRSALADDLDTATALAAVDEWARRGPERQRAIRTRPRSCAPPSTPCSEWPSTAESGGPGQFPAPGRPHQPQETESTARNVVAHRYSSLVFVRENNAPAAGKGGP